MKIILLSSYFTPHVGGVERHVEGLARNLHERGFEVEVITSSSSGRGNFPFSVRRWWSIHLPYSPIIPFLRRRLERIEGDIFHSHTPPPFFSHALRKSPHVITYHCDVELPSSYRGIPIPKGISKAILRKTERMLCEALERAEAVIATTRSYAESSRILKNKDFRVIPNAVDPKEFEGEEIEKEPLILFVGRLSYSKGVDVLIKALRELEVRARCVIIGDGEDRRRFEALAKELGTEVEFTGYLPREEVIRNMKRASLLVLPSISRLEAFGIVLLEAMACGTPVAASDIPGVGEIAREAGFVFPAGDYRRLAEIINEVLSDEQKVRRIGERAKKVVKEKYSWDVVVERIIELYEEVS